MVSKFQQSLVRNNILEQNRKMQEEIRSMMNRNVLAQDLSELVPRLGERLDTMGNIGIFNHNAILFASGEISPRINIPVDTFIEDNILVIEATGNYFQNTGSSQTIEGQVFLGPSSGLILVSSGATLSVGSSTQPRMFEYRIKITQAPNLGNYVRVDERLMIESATAGAAQVVVRSSIVQVTSVTELSEIDTFVLQFIMSPVGAVKQVYSNTVTVSVLDGNSDEVKNFHTNNGTSARIRSDTPTVASDLITIGEHNALAAVFRTLIKAPDLSNIPSNAILEEARLCLKISGDLSSNSGIIEAWRVLRDWATPTWNEFSPGNAWGSTGCGNSTTAFTGA